MEKSADLIMTVLYPESIIQSLRKCRNKSFEEAEEVLCRAM